MEGGGGEGEKRKRLRRKPNNSLFSPSLPFSSRTNFRAITLAKLATQASFEAETGLSVLSAQPSNFRF